MYIHTYAPVRGSTLRACVLPVCWGAFDTFAGYLLVLCVLYGWQTAKQPKGILNTECSLIEILAVVTRTGFALVVLSKVSFTLDISTNVKITKQG